LSVLNVLATNNSVHLSIVGGLTLKTTMSWPCCSQSLTNHSYPPLFETALDIHPLLTFQSTPFLFMSLTVRLSIGHEYPITWGNVKKGWKTWISRQDMG